MGSKHEFKGKNVDEAITCASDKLGVPREELNIKILSTGSSGIFGLCRKQAVIRVTKKIREPDSTSTEDGESAFIPPVDQKQESSAPVPAPADTAKPLTEQLPPVAKPSTGESDEKVAPVEPSREQAAPLTPDILAQIKSDLEQLLKLMGFPSKIEVVERNNKASVKICGEHVEQLISNDGQALDSIQYLMRKIIGKKFPQRVFFSIDAGDFREKRKAELQELALKLAQEVKETEKTRTIAPLNPAERRVVHLVLQEDKTIRSRSVGEGLFKKILIYLPGKGRVRRKPQRRRGKKDKLTIPE